VFVKQLQEAFRKGDRRLIASMIEYPLLVTNDRGKRQIRGKQVLLANFGDVFDATTICVIERAKPDELFGNWQGFMIGNGQVWFDKFAPAKDSKNTSAPDFWTKYPFKIKTVNHESGNVPCEMAP